MSGFSPECLDRFRPIADLGDETRFDGVTEAQRTMMKEVALLLAVGAVPLMSPPNAPPVASAEEACAAVKAHVISRNSRAASVIAFCDHIPETESPRGYYVMALHSNRECDGICSTNMGWFAVRKDDGDVFEWDVAEWDLGQPIGSKP